MPKAEHAWRLRGPARFFCEAFLKQSTPQKMFYETVALKQKVRKGIRQINNLPQSGTSCGPGRQPPSSAPLVAERCRTNRQRPEPPSVKSPPPWALTTRNSCTAGYARKLLPVAPQTYSRAHATLILLGPLIASMQQERPGGASPSRPAITKRFSTRFSTQG